MIQEQDQGQEQGLIEDKYQMTLVSGTARPYL